jgi:hypothetical protein
VVDAFRRVTDVVEDTLSRPRSRALLDFLDSTRPVWWVVRAWVALQVADLMFGGWPHGWMVSINGYATGAVVLLIAMVISVQIGRGVWWPGSSEAPTATWLLRGLNLFGAVALVAVLGQMPSGSYDDSYVGVAWDPGQRADGGLRIDGEPVSNVFAYDAAGQPLTGVQLFDQAGEPLAIKKYERKLGPRSFEVAYPWAWTMSPANDSTNVFPMPVRRQVDTERGADGGEAPAIILPFARVPELPIETRAEMAKVQAQIEADKSGSRLRIPLPTAAQ